MKPKEQPKPQTEVTKELPKSPSKEAPIQEKPQEQFEDIANQDTEPWDGGDDGIHLSLDQSTLTFKYDNYANFRQEFDSMLDEWIKNNENELAGCDVSTLKQDFDRVKSIKF